MTGVEQPLRVLVAEDEPLARDYLLGLLAKRPGVSVVAVCRNGLEAVRALAEHRPDLALLDIEMPKLDAFEVLELAEHPVAVVFVTAYDEHAVRAFEAEAVDYVLKPFSAERLGAALDRAARRLETAPPLDPGTLRRAARPEAPALDRLAIKDGPEITLVSLDQIDYVRAEDDYVCIHAAGREHLKHQTLASLEASLDPRRFVRIHRSCLVNVQRVRRIEPETRDRFSVHLADGTVLGASRSGEQRLRAVLGL